MTYVQLKNFYTFSENEENTTVKRFIRLANYQALIDESFDNNKKY